MYWSCTERGNYSVWTKSNLSSSCIFSVVSDDWCVCNCNTWAHLVRIWRHSQNSTCQFLFHPRVTWMTDPLSPKWSHIQHMLTIMVPLSDLLLLIHLFLVKRVFSIAAAKWHRVISWIMRVQKLPCRRYDRSKLFNCNHYRKYCKQSILHQNCILDLPDNITPCQMQSPSCILITTMIFLFCKQTKMMQVTHGITLKVSPVHVAIHLHIHH